jgi:hypothetical protein
MSVTTWSFANAAASLRLAALGKAAISPDCIAHATLSAVHSHQSQSVIKRLGVDNWIGHGPQRRRRDLLTQAQWQPPASLAKRGIAHPCLVQQTRILRQGSRWMELMVNQSGNHLCGS